MSMVSGKVASGQWLVSVSAELWSDGVTGVWRSAHTGTRFGQALAIHMVIRFIKQSERALIRFCLLHLTDTDTDN
jgi:hypothetical protein